MIKKKIETMASALIPTGIWSDYLARPCAFRLDRYDVFSSRQLSLQIKFIDSKIASR